MTEEQKKMKRTEINVFNGVLVLPIEPIVSITWIWISIITTEIVTCCCVLNRRKNFFNQIEISFSD